MLSPWSVGRCFTCEWALFAVIHGGYFVSDPMDKHRNGSLVRVLDCLGTDFQIDFDLRKNGYGWNALNGGGYY